MFMATDAGSNVSSATVATLCVAGAAPGRQRLLQVVYIVEALADICVRTFLMNLCSHTYVSGLLLCTPSCIQKPNIIHWYCRYRTFVALEGTESGIPAYGIALRVAVEWC